MAYRKHKCWIPKLSVVGTLSYFVVSMVKFTTCEDSRTNNHKISDESIWVVGAAGIDVVANVDVFPKPDDKMRAKSLETFGGGNAANTATTLARLGVRTHLISKIGDDINSNFILNELKGEQVETWGIVKQLNSKSPITLVVVDSLTKTRTCIHHSNIVDLNDESVREFLDAMRMPNAPKIIHSDSRHTLGAIALAKEANKLNILVSLDMERVNRPHVQELLPLADLIFTNQTFPVDYYAHLSKSDGKVDLLEGMASLLFQGRAKVCITTLGSEGSILMMRAGSSFRSEICNKTSPIINPFQVSLLVCSPLKLKLQSTTIKFKTMNGNLIEEEFDVLRCSSWPMKNSEIIDTTGAGDAFIGGFLACVNHGLSREECMQIATIVASEKLRGLGSRLTLPTVATVNLTLQRNVIKPKI